MIAHLQRASNTAGLLAYLYGPGERGDQSNPHLVGGDCHGAPIDLLTHAYLAHALDAPVERLGIRAPERPVWVCSVRSDPRHRDLSDAQWAEVANRLAAVTVAPDGDPDACRWIGLRNQPRQVHVVATLAREDGRLHNAYRDAFRLQTECHRIAGELGHLPASPQPTSLVPEKSMPITVTIAAEPSGSVVARGGDSLAKSLLNHAGFAYTNDWHGPRHRLPTSMDRHEQAAVAAHAAEMLRAARCYTVHLDPALESRAKVTASAALSVGDGLVDLTDRIRATTTAGDLAREVSTLAAPDTGVLDRLIEALCAAEEQLDDLDPLGTAHALGDRFGVAWEHVGAAQNVLLGIDARIRHVGEGDHAQMRTATAEPPSTRHAALSASPAATQASASRTTTPSGPAPAPPAGPARDSAPRNR
ncbi:hypothetical protein [Streptomyces sp. CA-111067]|uniref:hypothetical protein n=1 Tax=Streptomyces sp. CA-111067 TaxID=3240046 RepID=UPI003D96529A